MYEELIQIQEMVDIAFTYSDVKVWTYDHTHASKYNVSTNHDVTPLSWISQPAAQFSSRILEFQDQVVESFLRALDGQEKPE